MKLPNFAVSLFICLAGLPAIFAADAVSRSSAGSTSAGGHSFRPLLSADGSRIVFVSHANNLVTNDNQREWLDVFMRDLVTSNTVLLSVNASGAGGGNGNSFGATVSSNGQFVAFASEADDLVSGDTNAASDVFVRDRVAGTTRMVSTDISDTAPVDADPFSIIPLSSNPMISGDGRWVFFESRSTNLVSLPDTNNAVDVFARDLQSSVTLLISRSDLAVQAANAGSELADVTPDGKRVAFISRATDLAAGNTNELGDVYVRDLTSNVTHWASGSLGYPDGYRCTVAALSENGRYVAFVVLAIAQPSALYRHDLEDKVSVLVGTNVSTRATPQISTDGRYVVFETGTNIFRWDAASGMTEMINVALSGLPPTNGMARNATMTADGNGVVFVSDSADLTTNNPSGVFQIYARDLTAGATYVISQSANGQQGVIGSEPSLMAVARDFSHVAFDSRDPRLVDGDANSANDVFVRDLSTATTHLVSARAPALPRTTGVGQAWLGTDSVSADGRVIAFTSYDNDLVPGDTNGWRDVFIHDLLTGSTVTPGFSTNMAKFPVISANGRYVVYSRFLFSAGSGLFPYGIGLYRFDRETGTNELVPSPDGFASTAGAKAAASPDGNLIAFRHNGTLYLRDTVYATNLSLGPGESIIRSDDDGDVEAVFTPNSRFVLFKSTQLYAYDLSTGRTHLVSGGYPGSGVAQAGYNGALSVSGNSRYVVFRSMSLGLIIHDLLSETNGFVHDGGYATVSAEGRFVAIAGDFSDPSLRGQVFVKDRQSGAVELVTVSMTGAPATMQFNQRPIISGDGRFVVFGARTSNLVLDDTNNLVDVFVRDRLLGATMLLSRNIEGRAGNAASAVRPVMAADGRTVVFHSMASDLIAGDYNDRRDLFVLKLGGADTDSDGMDDDWEVAYFGNLSRDGAADFDGDGVTDRAEFLAGTDPTNAGSVFRVLTVAPVGGGSTRLLWTGNPNRSYRAEFKDVLGSETWSPLAGVISWEGGTASILDEDASNSMRRFYRVVRLP